MEYEIFSRRQERIQNEIPDTYLYETIPDKLRGQIFYIWAKVWKEPYYNNFEELQVSRLAIDAYKSIEATLREEYGVMALDGADELDEDGYSFYWIVRKLLLEERSTDNVIDVIEISFRYIDQIIRDKFRPPAPEDELDDIFGTPPRAIAFDTIPSDAISPDEAINLLNRRFLQHRVGYQYESGQIVRVDTQYIHSEVVKPTLFFLSDPMYKGANEEFLKAHEHYQEGNHKDCVSNCLKAFESCLKTICEKRGWDYDDKNATANDLIQIVLNNELIPNFMESHFSGLRGALESGITTLRNRRGGHGQGPKPVPLPDYIAAYALHLTGSNILLLAKADEDRNRD